MAWDCLVWPPPRRCRGALPVDSPTSNAWSLESDIEHLIRAVPDFPQEGILFRDITPLLADPEGFATCIARLEEIVADSRPDVVVGIESRGFLFGTPLAQRLGVGFVPVRKPGKLPGAVKTVTYELEYGTDTLEMHEDAIEEGQRVLVVDDLLATGGTAEATAAMLREVGADIVGCAFVIELEDLNGRSRLDGIPVHALISY